LAARLHFFFPLSNPREWSGLGQLFNLFRIVARVSFPFYFILFFYFFPSLYSFSFSFYPSASVLLSLPREPRAKKPDGDKSHPTEPFPPPCWEEENYNNRVCCSMGPV
jgi:hypothetical protein